MLTLPMKTARAALLGQCASILLFGFSGMLLGEILMELG